MLVAARRGRRGPAAGSAPSDVGWSSLLHAYGAERPIAPVADGRHAGQNHVHAATPTLRP